MTIDTGPIRLGLPQPPRVHVPEPENEDPLPHHIAQPHTRHWIETDRTIGRMSLHIASDSGLTEHPETGMSSRDRQNEVWSIDQGDPTSSGGPRRLDLRNQPSGLAHPHRVLRGDRLHR